MSTACAKVTFRTAIYKVVEYDGKTCEPTGIVQYYQAENAAHAVSHVKYNLSFKYGRNVVIGPTGRAIYAGGKVYIVTLDRVKN